MIMELKVWVEGLQRIVCGVNAATTCQDVVYALAHATGQTGRFTLVERWRNNERVLAPHERPLKVLAKWGEYASDVHFILRRSPALPVSPPTAKINQPKEAAVKKSLTFSGARGKKDEEGVTFPPSNGSGPMYQQIPVQNSMPAHAVPPRAHPSHQGNQPTTGPMGNRTKPMSPPPYRSPPSVQRTPPVGTLGGRDDIRNDVHVVYDARYRDLIRLVNMQKETLNSQQAQLTQYDAEIGYWEENHKEQIRRGELIDSEMRRLEITNHEATEEESSLDPWRLNEDLERGAQQERSLHSELTLLKSKLTQCETDLFQCRNKIRTLMDELTEERERNILNDIENLRQEIAEKLREYDNKVSPLEVLAAEVEQIESAISHKRNEVESMVRQIKEANLQSLSITAGTDDIKHLDGGAFSRPSSTRRMVGSPRQLENAVPTSKNPHGIWV